MDQGVGSGEPPDPQHSHDVAGMGRPPHLEPLPHRAPFLDPAWQITGRRAGHSDFIPAAHSSLNQITDAYGHALDGGLRDDQDAIGSSRRGPAWPACADRFPRMRNSTPQQPPLASPEWLHS